MKMTQEIWDDMTAQERSHYLLNHPIKCEHQAGLDGNAKVGDPDAVSMYFRFSSGDVTLTQWYSCQLEALAECVQCLQNWAEEAKKEALTEAEKGLDELTSSASSPKSELH